MNIYGGNYRGACPLESQEQAAFVQYIRTAYPSTHGRLCVHVKNEGRKTYGQAAYDRKHGQVKGASDIVIPAHITFVCEIKRKDRTKSKLSQDQKSYLETAERQGAYACVAYGYDAAVAAFRDWLDIIKD